MDREEFTSSPGGPAALQTAIPCWNLSFAATQAALRRIWQVRPSRVSPRCWNWLTSGYGPPWQEERR